MTSKAPLPDFEVETVVLDGGAFWMGNEGSGSYPQDGEGPRHRVFLDPFGLSARCVTNEEYAAFVAATEYRTDAERLGASFVFGGLLPDDFPPTRGVAVAPWWREVPGASWKFPEGEGSGIADRMDHPVVHVSWNDAMAFCAWSGTRLPTEAEWEYAARGGRVGDPFPWGDALEPNGKHRMNVFQGRFPAENTEEDGWAGTCPVQTFPPNGFGLFEMTGNVWEWCADWFAMDTYQNSPLHNPRGPDRGQRGSCAEVPTSVTRVTAVATEWTRGVPTRLTAAPVISVFGWRGISNAWPSNWRCWQDLAFWSSFLPAWPHWGSG